MLLQWSIPAKAFKFSSHIQETAEHNSMWTSASIWPNLSEWLNTKTCLPSQSSLTKLAAISWCVELRSLLYWSGWWNNCLDIFQHTLQIWRATWDHPIPKNSMYVIIIAISSCRQAGLPNVSQTLWKWCVPDNQRIGSWQIWELR